ncbi:alpha/beta hydrolase [Aeromicrobium sp.]|uniref:alpha/beta hydrolase n=1 Tax=Aeromicrobium sp. TaxID=1871063 RepID=UPI0025C4829B|nr:alpha/beta hydrolase [Aeromicrobium sp.]
MNRVRTSLVIATLLAFVVGVVVVSAYVTRDSWSKPSPVSAPAPGGLGSFYQQTLTWTDCEKAHCTWVKVPVDYAKPDGATTRLRVRLYPAEGGPAERSLFVNPGGPGGSAVDYATSMESSFGKGVRDAYDVVGVDPRGVGESSPLECLSATSFDTFTETDPDPDTPAEITALRSSLTSLGEACRKNSGELAAHVSTVEAAKDMDVTRALLGRSKLDWFGASYGTQLGAVYAQLFPKKVGRMVLDGAVDPALGVVDSSLGQATGFQRALSSYAAACVKKSSCPLGSNAGAGLSKIADLMKQLDAEPMKASADRSLTEGQAFYGIAVTLYDKSTWNLLSRALTDAFKGDGSTLLLLSDAYFERQPDGTYAGNLGQVIYAVNCLDTSDGLTQAQTEALIPRFEKVSPVFGRSLAWGALGCADWPIKPTNPLPKISAEGAPPILVIGTTRDPATPYEWAKSLADQLSSGVLLTRDGDGHTAYGSGNACITSTVDAFLTKGKVPKANQTCK